LILTAKINASVGYFFLEISMKDSVKNAQVSVVHVSPSYWKVVINNPPLNLMEPNIIVQFRGVLDAIESDDNVRVVVFESAVDGFFFNHSDFNVKLEKVTDLSQGPTGLEAWPDILQRLPRAPVVSIAKIRGRATGNGSELSLACDMTFASREKAILSQWEVGVGFVPGGGPMARLPRLIGRSRALEVLLGSDDMNGQLAEDYGYVNRALPDAELDAFVDALARRISVFDKWAISNVKRLVNAASLAPEVELAAGWDAFIASVARPAPQVRLKAFRELGWHKPGEAETHMGAYLERINR
jgi:enoyl-CoA hydratase/carnithine racemase